MGRFLSSCSHVLTMIVHVQISVALFLNKCPEKLMWTLRAKQLCGVEDKYMCLYDTNERSFRELCKDAPEFHRPGNIFVISGNLQYFAGRPCYSNTYQPHKWWTNGSSECQYLKSSCNGEGQVPYDNGTITRDRKCRCDYTNYYTSVMSTKNKCHCNPTEEDCSCYRKGCSGDQVLTPDYDCVGIHEWTGQFVCPEYKHPKIIDEKKLPQPTICPNIKKDSSGTIQQARIAVSLISGALVILSLIFIIRRASKEDITEVEAKCDAGLNDVAQKILKLNEERKDVIQSYMRDYFLEDPANIECIEGEKATLTCTLRPQSPSIKWLKDGKKINPNEKFKMLSKETEHQLELNNTTASDNGVYRVEVGICYRTLKLKIIDYFLEYPSNIECMEGEDAILTCTVRPQSPPIQWLIDNRSIKQNENCIMYNKDTKHYLILKNTKPSNAGEYCVIVGKFSRKIKLKIIGYFLEDPSNIECIEGEDAISTCKVRLGNTPVKWLKDGIEIEQNKSRTLSSVATPQGRKVAITLMNTNASDIGEYCVKVGKFSRKLQVKVKEIPSKAHREMLMEAINNGKEVRRFVRINVVGKSGVGKSSLVRRLLGQTMDYMQSTDGIEIDNTCQIRLSNGEWIVGEVLTEMQQIQKRVLRSVNLNTDQDKTQKGHMRNPSEDHLLPAEKHETITLPTDENNLLPVDENKFLLSNEKIDKIEPFDVNIVSKKKDNDSVTTYTQQNTNGSSNNPYHNTLTVTDSFADKPIRISENQTHVNSDHITKAMNDAMDDILLEMNNRKKTKTSDGLVGCGIWDFAGQKDYHVTHQLFFTPDAIYILVADITEKIRSCQYDDDFNNYASEDHIDFWLDQIHCFCEDIRKSTEKKLRPPIIMVITGIDKVPNEYRETYKRKLLEIVGCQEKGSHIRSMIHFISIIESPKEDFENLREHISKIAKEMQFFAEVLPTRWIQLENAISVLKQLRKRENLGYCEKWENIEKLAQKMSIEEEELCYFLKYQHKIGNVICFTDERDYIILEPNWLVDCFRCLVCDDGKKMCTVTEVYDLKNKGILSDQLIDKLFSKVPELRIGNSKNHILDVLEKFDIIIKLENSYYMPCMIEKSSTIPQIKNEFNVESSNCTPWLILEFAFLPIAFYNHILFKYIKENLVCEVKQENEDGRPAIYAGKAVVYLDTTKCRKLIICFSKNAICIQIWKWRDVDEITYQNILEKLCNTIEDIEKKLNYKLNYKIKSKCSNGDYRCRIDRITYEDLPTLCIGQEYRCKEHNTMHNKEDMENTWLKHVPVVIGKNLWKYQSYKSGLDIAAVDKRVAEQPLLADQANRQEK